VQKKRMTPLDWLAWSLVILAALNWGLIALANANIVQMIFGGTATLMQAIYVLMGVAGLYQLWLVLGSKK
jgi:uncharacterized membrane protein YuzA (DUF378 family)